MVLGAALQLSSGMKLVSQVCETQVIVVRAPVAPADLRCGGLPMVPTKADETPHALDPKFAAGSQLGKRYVNTALGLEVLCVHAGSGSVSLGDEALELKAAKPLPTSD
jgi:hypothetical protein